MARSSLLERGGIWRRTFWGAAILLTAFVGLIVLALVLLRGPMGASLARDLLSGRDLAGWGEIELGPVTGNVLDDFKVEYLSVSDADGVWIEAHDVSVRWSPRGLVSRHVDVGQVSAREVTLLRRPVRAILDERSARSSPWSVSLGAAKLNEIEVNQTVAGLAAVLSADLSFSSGADGMQVRFQAERLDVPGDRVLVHGVVGERVEIEAEIIGAPDGLIAAIAPLGGAGLSLRLSAVGDRQSGSGSARVHLDDMEVLSSEAVWQNQLLSVSAQTWPNLWPIDTVQTLLGSEPVHLNAEIPWRTTGWPELSDATSIELSADAVTVSVTPAGLNAFDLDVALGEALPTRIAGDGLGFDNAHVSGRLTFTDGANFLGDVSLDALTLSDGVSAEMVSGRIGVGLDASNISLSTDLAISDLSGLPVGLDDAIGAAPRISATTQFNRAQNILLMDQIGLSLQAGTLTGSGRLDLEARTWAAVLQSEALALGDLTESVTGSGQVTVQAQGDFTSVTDALVEFSEFGTGGNLASNIDGPVSGAVQLANLHAGGADITRAQINASAFGLVATGQITPDNQVFAGDVLWSGPSPIDGLELSSTLAATFEVRSSPSEVRARLDASNDGVSISGQALSNPRLRADIFVRDGGLEGQVRLTGSHASGAVDLEADFDQTTQGLQIRSVSGQAGAFDLTLQGQLAPDNIALEGTVVPRFGRGQFEAALALVDGEVEGRIVTAGLELASGARLTQSQITLSGPLDAINVRAQLEGRYGAAFTTTLDGRVTRREGTSTLEFEGSGRYDRIGFATLAPARMVLGSHPAMDLFVDVEGGEIELRADFGAAPVVTARVEAVPAAILSLRRRRTPVEGRLDGQVDLRQREGVWTGRARLTGSDLRQPDFPDDRPINGSMDVTLTERDLAAQVEAQGPDLNARAQIHLVTGAVSGLAQLRDPDLALSGEVFASGDFGRLAAFQIEEGQILQGQIDLNASLGGVLADPVLDGALEISDARFRDDRIGLDLQDLSAVAAFTQSGASLTALSAGDGRAGRLTARGQVSFSGGLSGDATVTFEHFQLVAREGIEARASGDVLVSYGADGGQITGSAVIEQADLRPPETVSAPIAQIEVTEINRPLALDSPQPERARFNLAVDYQLRAPRRIFVRGDNFDTEWGFDLTISGPSHAPLVAGEAEIVRGRADVLGRDFVVSRGEVLLDGDPDEAQLYVEAVNIQPGFTARISASGKVTDPEIALSSDPGLPEDEIVSRILFGESAAGLSALQAAQMAGALASFSGAGHGFDPLGQLRDATGLDMLGVRRNSSGETVLAGGRYLSDDVFLTVESAMGAEGTQSRIDWTLTPRFTLSSSLNAQGRAGVALLWQIDYDDDPFGEMRLFRGFQSEAPPSDVEEGPGGDDEG